MEQERREADRDRPAGDETATEAAVEDERDKLASTDITDS
jgi:hypothetical protein